MPYGYELILDLHGCDTKTFNRKSLTAYFKALCNAIQMKRCKLVFWDDLGVPEEERQTSPHTTGTSAVQFILTSNVTVHTLDLLGSAYINIFSCKQFDPRVARKITEEWFHASTVTGHFLERTSG